MCCCISAVAVVRRQQQQQQHWSHKEQLFQDDDAENNCDKKPSRKSFEAALKGCTSATSDISRTEWKWIQNFPEEKCNCQMSKLDIELMTAFSKELALFCWIWIHLCTGAGNKDIDPNAASSRWQQRRRRRRSIDRRQQYVGCCWRVLWPIFYARKLIPHIKTQES